MTVLKKFSTVPNLSSFSFPSSSHQPLFCKPTHGQFHTTYAATDGGRSFQYGEEDEEMTSYSGASSTSSTSTDADTDGRSDSGDTQDGEQMTTPDTSPDNTSNKSNKLRRLPSQQRITPSSSASFQPTTSQQQGRLDITAGTSQQHHSLPAVVVGAIGGGEHVHKTAMGDDDNMDETGAGLLETHADYDESMVHDEFVHASLSEWESTGGLYATQAAFEGTMLLDASLNEITDWCAPIVWKMYLRQATQCSSQQRHQYLVPLDTPCPSFFPKLLTRAMPRYKGGLTRALALTHALLYLHRVKTCFHCTTVSSAPTFVQQKVQYPDPSSTSASSSPQGSVMSKEEFRTAITNVAAQCSLFFAVGMHYASLWLLDCCPSENMYWKRYVHCVQSAHGIAWSRLVLQHWNYQINVSVEDWMTFSAQLLSKFPFVDDEKRARLLVPPSSATKAAAV